MNNNNISCLPFYQSLDEQHANKEYAFGRVYPLLCPVNYILPFVILRENRTGRDFSIYLYNVKGEKINDLTGQISQTGLSVQAFDGYDAILYNGKLPLTGMQEGFYYLTLNDGTQTWYSELFNLVSDKDRLLCVEWWDEEPLYFKGGCIPYDKGRFTNRLYFDTKIGKPEYDFQEEGEERDGIFFPVSQLSEKIYKFCVIAPEYLCDVMRLIRMSEYVKITSEGKTYDAEQFLCNVEWQDQGDLAAVSCEFQSETIAKKIGKGFILSQRGDFDNSYSTDYNTN